VIIDFHTHITAPEIIARREEYCVCDAWFRELYTDPKACLSSAEDLMMPWTARRWIALSPLASGGGTWTSAGVTTTMLWRQCSASRSSHWLRIVNPAAGDAAVHGWSVAPPVACVASVS